eukprot:323356-Alexandrium_andersonii.AAC.1
MNEHGKEIQGGFQGGLNTDHFPMPVELSVRLNKEDKQTSPGWRLKGLDEGVKTKYAQRLDEELQRPEGR